MGRRATVKRTAGEERLKRVRRMEGVESDVVA
jgi:hypothetical protein